MLINQLGACVNKMLGISALVPAIGRWPKCGIALPCAVLFVAADPGGVGGVVKQGTGPVAISSISCDPGGSGGMALVLALQQSRIARGGSDGVGGIPTKVTGGPDGVGGLPFIGGGPNGAGGIPVAARGHRSHLVFGDPNSAGSIPHSGDPTGAGGIPVTVPFAPTAGLILDATTAPIGGVTILILSFDGSVIAAATTNELGAFALNLPKVPGMTLVVPALDVYDVPVIAGAPLLVIVP